MRITVSITDKEVAGIKNYLREVGDNSKPEKKDIEEYIKNIVYSTLENPAESVSDYIKAARA